MPRTAAAPAPSPDLLAQVAALDAEARAPEIQAQQAAAEQRQAALAVFSAAVRAAAGEPGAQAPDAAAVHAALRTLDRTVEHLQDAVGWLQTVREVDASSWQDAMDAVYAAREARQQRENELAAAARKAAAALEEYQRTGWSSIRAAEANLRHVEDGPRRREQCVTQLRGAGVEIEGADA